MSQGLPPLPPEISVRRSADPIYMAHGYLTKVPVRAIIPFSDAFTNPATWSVDPFAGSGMTGVAAFMTGRRAALSDISCLGRHIGSNYIDFVDPKELRPSTRQLEDSGGRASNDEEQTGTSLTFVGKRIAGLAHAFERPGQSANE
jgi:hypothetical protein